MNMQPESFDLLRITGLKGRGDKRDRKYATFNRRMLAATVDSLLIMLLVAPLIDYVFTVTYGPAPVDLEALRAHMQTAQSEEEIKALLATALYNSGFVTRYILNSLAQLVVMFAFTAWFWRKWSATPGKMLLRIKVVDANTEEPLTNEQIWLRLCGYIISCIPLFLGVIWIGIDKRRQAWHDKIADTVVIVVPWKKDAENTHITP
jgi:uncharacterized RDD family membrane protein YckC